MHATIPKGNMGYDQYTVPDDCSCRTYFCCFPLALANIRPWPLVPFFEISLKNSVLKTTHNTFRYCRVHFFRQPFSKQLYIINTTIKVNREINKVNQFLTISNHFAINFLGAPEDTQQKFYTGKLLPEGLTPYLLTH